MGRVTAVAIPYRPPPPSLEIISHLRPQAPYSVGVKTAVGHNV